jgi:HD-like signal output (HDOD) protein
MILEIYMPKEYKEIHELYGKGMSLVDAEMYITGRTHALVGRLLARKWNFTKGMEEMIAFHHKPALAKVAPAHVAAVHIGNEIAKALSLGKSNELFVMPIDEDAWNMFFTKESTLTDTLEVIQDGYTQIEESFELDG